uniref:Uncharacterized protein n=1 Tax=Myotis myotis TaxID=51298 RepID=A0A7J7T6I9_MYOMY|nr:hypothetical protein mMyoMyo1_009159 [Myotis myotis]
MEIPFNKHALGAYCGPGPDRALLRLETVCGPASTKTPWKEPFTCLLEESLPTSLLMSPPLVTAPSLTSASSLRSAPLHPSWPWPQLHICSSDPGHSGLAPSLLTTVGGEFPRGGHWLPLSSGSPTLFCGSPISVAITSFLFPQTPRVWTVWVQGGHWLGGWEAGRLGWGAPLHLAVPIQPAETREVGEGGDNNNNNNINNNTGAHKTAVRCPLMIPYIYRSPSLPRHFRALAQLTLPLPWEGQLTPSFMARGNHGPEKAMEVAKATGASVTAARCRVALSPSFLRCPAPCR